MEGLDVQSHIKDRVMTEEQEDSEQNGEQDEGETEASSPVVSSTEEETDEDSEPEPPPVIRRKVSFADAFGLNLVSVKEFDNAEATEPEPSWSNGRNIVKAAEEIYLSCLFTVPSSTEELDQRLGEQMVELESIELLPGTTTLRGIVRVVNLCYNKTVFARLTLDRWSSYFDLLADYVPGSSDRKTDRFTFRYTVVPPFEKEGTRVEFCLRYETPMGTFWANNKGMNYVMFCHQKAQVKEGVTQTEEETSSYKSKRSCLKANR
uniref:CBM21 domain-containing protein n=2 Tax=Poecilia mexicana TaxID=48701 RepID=A0A3B3YSS3_9TELE